VIARFISTHPDGDHLRGLERLEAVIGSDNIYCVKNAANKEDETDSFAKYCALRDDPQRAFCIFKGCSRKWMNQGDDDPGSWKRLKTTLTCRWSLA
jgi:beta-lactamase superfamily II metal-dependent hydrolase